MAPVVLITGASGLLGRHVLHHWKPDELKPVLVDRREDDLLVPGTPASLVRRVRPRAVLHLAWTASGTLHYRSSPDNIRWFEASLELARACEAIGAHFFGTGTALETAEADDEYSASKVLLRSALDQRIATGEVSWLRPYYVVDPNCRRPALLAYVMDARDRGESVILRTPESVHDFVHAADVGRAIALAVRHQLVGDLAIGSGKLRRVSELVEALGVPWRRGDGRPVSTPHLHDVADTAPLRAQGWSPTSTEEMFTRV